MLHVCGLISFLIFGLVSHAHGVELESQLRGLLLQSQFDESSLTLDCKGDPALQSLQCLTSWQYLRPSNTPDERKEFEAALQKKAAENPNALDDFMAGACSSENIRLEAIDLEKRLEVSRKESGDFIRADADAFKSMCECYKSSTRLIFPKKVHSCYIDYKRARRKIEENTCRISSSQGRITLRKIGENRWATTTEPSYCNRVSSIVLEYHPKDSSWTYFDTYIAGDNDAVCKTEQGKPNRYSTKAEPRFRLDCKSFSFDLGP